MSNIVHAVLRSGNCALVMYKRVTIIKINIIVTGSVQVGNQ